MQAICQNCGSKHVLDDKQIGSHARVRFRCSGCGQSTEVDVGGDTNRTFISTGRADAVPYVEPTVLEEQRGLGLPTDKKISVRVTTGKSKGLELVLHRPRMIIGRLGADMAVEDSEVSRWHCAVEVSGGQIILRDLDSRNGVYFGEQKVKSVELQHDSEFRIGSTLFRLIITPK